MKRPPSDFSTLLEALNPEHICCDWKCKSLKTDDKYMVLFWRVMRQTGNVGREGDDIPGVKAGTLPLRRTSRPLGHHDTLIYGSNFKKGLGQHTSVAHDMCQDTQTYSIAFYTSPNTVSVCDSHQLSTKVTIFSTLLPGLAHPDYFPCTTSICMMNTVCAQLMWVKSCDTARHSQFVLYLIDIKF